MLKPDSSTFSPLSNSTLAIVRMECFVQDGTGAWVNRGGFVPFVDSLAPYFKSIEVVAPVVAGLSVPKGARSFRASNVIFRPLPNLQGLARCWTRGSKALRMLDEWSEGWDLVNLRAPDNFLPMALRYVQEKQIPHYVQLVSHPGEVETTAIKNLRPALRVIARRLWRSQRNAIEEACNGSLCIAHGSAPRDLAESWGARAVNLPSGSISAADMPLQSLRGAPRQLLFVGRVDPEKGLDVLIDCLPTLADLNLELVIAGWSTGDTEQRLRNQAERLGVAPSVRFIGPVAHGKELFELYHRADIFVLPSTSEGTPRVIGEAMAFGLPVISTRAGGIPDIVEHEKTGLLVAPGNPQPLGRAIRRMVTDERLRNSIVREANLHLHGRTLESVASAHARAIADAFVEVSVGIPQTVGQPQ